MKLIIVTSQAASCDVKQLRSRGDKLQSNEGSVEEREAKLVLAVANVALHCYEKNIIASAVTIIWLPQPLFHVIDLFSHLKQ